MKMEQAREMLSAKPPGFRVHFEHVEPGCLRGDFFPDSHEVPIPTEAEAWGLANRFASKTFGRCVNIYVIDQDYGPVKGYEAKRIVNSQ